MSSYGVLTQSLKAAKYGGERSNAAITIVEDLPPTEYSQYMREITGGLERLMKYAGPEETAGIARAVLVGTATSASTLENAARELFFGAGDDASDASDADADDADDVNDDNDDNNADADVLQLERRSADFIGSGYSATTPLSEIEDDKVYFCPNIENAPATTMQADTESHSMASAISGNRSGRMNIFGAADQPTVLELIGVDEQPGDETDDDMREKIEQMRARARSPPTTVLDSALDD